MVIHRRSKVSIVKVKTVKWEFNLGKDRNTEWTKDMLHIDDFEKKKKKCMTWSQILYVIVQLSVG